MLSCEFCELSKSIFFSEHLRTTATVSLDYPLTSFRTWLNVGFTIWNPLVENISSVSTIVFKIHVVMTLVFQEKCDVKFLHWHEICSTCEKTFQIAFNSIWLFFAEIKEHCKVVFGHSFSNVISTNPFVYWRRVSRTTLYALSSYFIIYNFFFFLQAYFLHISLKAHMSK